MKVVNVFSSDYDPYSGYGSKALMLVCHLTRLGYHVNALGGDSLKAEKNLSPELIALLNKPIIPAFGGIVLGYPTLIKQFGTMLRAGPYIVQTMFESTVLPEGWTEALNRAAAVSVPSRWLVGMMRDNGVTVPIAVHPESIGDGYHYVERGPYPEVFNFLTLGDRGVRKGWDLAVRAFSLAFGDDPRFKLIIKTREKNDFLKYLFSNTNIEILQADYSEAELQALYARVHAYAFPTRGEGYGMTPREAAATGLPVLCTNWSGVADDLDLWGIPLPYQMVDAWANDVHEGCGQWAEVDVNLLAQKMKIVATLNFYEQWYRDRNYPQDRAVANAVRQLYSWEEFATNLAALWESVSSKESAHACH